MPSMGVDRPVAGVGGAGGGPSAGEGFEVAVCCRWRRRSSRTMRPPGPVPSTVLRSTAFSRAILLARGEALTRSAPSSEATWGADERGAEVAGTNGSASTAS